MGQGAQKIELFHGERTRLVVAETHHADHSDVVLEGYADIASWSLRLVGMMEKGLMDRSVEQKERLAACCDLSRSAVVEVDGLEHPAPECGIEKKDRFQAGKVLLDDIDRGVVEADGFADGGDDLPDEFRGFQFGRNDPTTSLKRWVSVSWL